MEKKKLTDFEVMDKMAAANMDIAMCPDVIAVDQFKSHGKVTFGVPLDAAQKVGLNNKKYYVAMYIINKEQFDQLKQNS